MSARSPISSGQAWSSRTPLLIGFMAIALLVVGVGSWSFMTTISGAIIAPGRIEVEQARQVVQHPDGGVVAAIFVGEGDYVEADGVLLRLDDTLLNAELAIIESELYEVVARRSRLAAERDSSGQVIFDSSLLEVAKERPRIQDLVDGQRRLFNARHDTLREERKQLETRKVQIRSQIAGNLVERDALNSQLELIQKEVADLQGLFEKGLIPVTRLLALQREEARLRGEVNRTEASEPEYAGRITEIDIQKLKLSAQRREEAITQLRDLQFRETELSEKRQKILEILSRLDIRAPSSGIVYGMQVDALRSVIRPGATIMRIVPQGKPFVIASRVAPINIDQVFLGQEVTIRFPAFGRRATPEIPGRVSKISADVFVEETKEVSYYRIEIIPDANATVKLEDLRLLPGMPVETYLRTADRTPLNYLFKPLSNYFNRAFRDDLT